MKISAGLKPGTKEVLIVPSDFQPDEEKEVQVHLLFDGKDPEQINFIARRSSQMPQFTVSPTSVNTYHSHDVTLQLSGVTGTISATSDNSNITFEIKQAEKQVIVKADSAQTGTLTITADSHSVQVPVTFLALQTIAATVDPTSLKLTKDKTFTITVTSSDDVSAKMKTGTGMTITPSSGKSFTVTCKNATAGTDTVVLSHVDYEEKEIQLTFREKDEVSHTISKSNATVGEEIVITVNGLSQGREIEAESSDSKATIRVEGNLVKVNATQAVTSTITVRGKGASAPYVEEFTEQVTYAEPGKDTITVTLNPVNGQAVKGSTITAEISGTSSAITAKASDKKISVTKNRDDKHWNITSSQAVTGTVTFSGTKINEKQVSVEFTEPSKPQFTVTDTDVTINETDMPYDITVTGLTGTLKAKVSNPLVYKVEVSGSTATVSYINPEFNHSRDDVVLVTLSVEGQKDVVVSLRILDVPAKTLMPCNGLVLEGYTDQEIYFNGPTVDKNDVLSATCDNPAVTVQVRDVNRVYVNTGKNAPLGVYKITVSHSEYLDSVVTYKCIEKPTKPVPPTGTNEWYDLGEAPKVTITTTPDDFVKEVFEDGQITTDAGRIAYVLEHGSADLRGAANMFCTYNMNVGTNQPVPLDSTGGRWNRLVFDQFLYVFGLADYYTFRNNIRLIIKIMKHYRQTSMSTILMVRFDAGWIGSREELALYKNIVAFLNKYIDANGQHVSVNGLELTGDALKNMSRYCEENIQP